MKKIYLAGPEVFLPNAKEIGEKKKKLCEKYGFEGIFPLDNEIDVSKLTPHEIGLIIGAVNESLIQICDLVIANITPFRSPSLDVGTAYEIGYAKASNLTIFAYSTTSELFSERVSLFLGLDIRAKTDRMGMQIERFEMVDNLMIDGGIIGSSGNIILTDVSSLKEKYTDLDGFEKCLILAKEKFG